MSNPWKDYLQDFRGNLPAGVTYRGDIARYVFNDKRFILPNDVVRYNNYLEKLGFGVTFDPDALAYITAVETADGEALEAGVKDAINDFVVGCKADGIWDALKTTCILAGARTLNGCLVPLKGAAPTGVNFVSADYSRKTGLIGDRNTKHINSNRAGNADPQNDQHISVFLTELPDFDAENRNYNHIGLSDGTDISQIVYGNSAQANIFRSRGIADYQANRSDDGFLGISRSASASFIARTGGVNNTFSATSKSPASINYFVFARNSSGSADLYSRMRISFYSIGEAIDLAALDARVSTLMTALDEAIA